MSHLHAPSDTLILMGYDDNAAPYGDIGRKSWSDYADRHGHPFACIREFTPDTHPSFQKLRLLLEALNSYPQVFWTDADSVVTNDRRPLFGTIPDFALHEMAASADWDARSRSPWSAGHLFVNGASPRVRPFLQAAKALAPTYGNVKLWDQSAMHHVERVHYVHAASPVVVLPNRIWNSVPKEAQPGQDIDSEWHPGDLLAHITGVEDTNRRVSLMREFNFAAIR